MRPFFCLFTILIIGLPLYSQNTVHLSSNDRYIFRQKCTIEYAEQGLTTDVSLTKESTNPAQNKNMECDSSRSLKNVRLAEPTYKIQKEYLDEPDDSLRKTPRTKLRLDPTFELGMRDAKKYYRIRFKRVAENPKNPNNILLTKDPAYSSGYYWGIQKKHKKLTRYLIVFGVLVAIPLLFIIFLSIAGASGGWWF